MSRPMLRLYDGFDHTTPGLRDEVKELQAKLNKKGFSLKKDGLFGYSTEMAVKNFQRSHGLYEDGIVGPLTWAALLGVEPPDIDKTYPTTFPRNDESLLAQHDFQPSVIAGIGSRESHWGKILKPAGPGGTGDFAKRSFPTPFRRGPLPPDKGGFGRGLMQIDFDFHEFARGGSWKDPRANILYGAEVLSSSLKFLKGKTSLEGRDLLRAALAGYNAGPGNALSAYRDGRDIDFYTSGRDYSKDVLNRPGFFQLHGWV
jgi:hypothetical protein